MRMFRFCRRAIESYVGLLACLPTFGRLALPCMALSLAAVVLTEERAWLGQMADAVAQAVFAVAWLRFVALGELPQAAVPFRIGRREIFFAVFWMVVQSFVGLPAMMVGHALGIALGADPKILALPLLAVSHAVLGVFYLLPAEMALEDGGRPRWPVPDLIMQGGVAVGFGLVVAWAPPAAAVAWLEMMMGGTPSAGLGAALMTKALVVAPQFVGLAAVTGFLALVWRTLLAEAR